VLLHTRTDDTRPEASAAEVAWLLIGGLGLVGFWLNGLGPVLPLLQHDLHVSRGTVAFYPSAFALGLIVLGITAPRLTGPGRRHAVFTVAVLAMGGGACLISAAIAPVISLVGALVMGAGAALVVGLVPALSSDVEGTGEAGLVSRANALSSAAGLLAPLLIAGAVSVRVGWPTGYLVMPLVGAIAVLVLLYRVRLPDADPPPDEAGISLAAPAAGGPPAARDRPATVGPPADGDRPAAGRNPPGDPLDASTVSVPPETDPWRLWLSLVLAVSAEMCVVFWAPSYLHSNLGLRTATASALAGAFLLGMATGRASVTPVTSRLGTGNRAIFTVTGVAVAGFAIFWFADVAWLATIGLGVIGLGIALMYPLTVARYVAAAPTSSTRASARAALGSGVAIAVAPFVLATISDATGLHAAYLLVPVLCAALVINTRLIHRSVTA
jgi:MFS family permease